MQTFGHRRRGQRHSCVDTRGIAIPLAALMEETLWQLAHADCRFDFPSSTENMKSLVHHSGGKSRAILNQIRRRGGRLRSGHHRPNG